MALRQEAFQLPVAGRPHASHSGRAADGHRCPGDAGGMRWPSKVIALRQIKAALACTLCALVHIAAASSSTAGPTNYREAVRRLQPGDTLHLEPGEYRDGLELHEIQGTGDAPISIVGARGTRRSIFIAPPGRNTISIVNSAYLRIASLELLGKRAGVDAVKAEGTSRFAHDITIERLRIEGYDASQQNVAISTKCPAWNWVIRNNVIIGAGTGMYLGDSDGSAPFVRGVIEGNLVMETRGYSIQIKHQVRWPESLAPLAKRGDTIVRYNTLIKDEHSSAGELSRPNLLLGHWPLSGKGSEDRYLVYGNLIVDNPHEALMQAEGNVTMYNNVLWNRHNDGLAIREHKDVPRTIDVFHNTIVARGSGILLRNGNPLWKQTVTGNVIFADHVTPGSLAEVNVFGKPDGTDWGDLEHSMSFSSLRHKYLAHRYPDLAWNKTGREDLPDVDRDFDRVRRTLHVNGAYSENRAPNSRRYQALDRRN